MSKEEVILLSETGIRDVFERQRDLIAFLGLRGFDEKLKLTQLEIQRNEFIVTIVGEFNRGKSYFVNAILGVDVIPTGNQPTTATINIIRYAKTPEVTVFKKDGSAQKGDFDVHYLEKLTAKYQNNINDIKYIEMGYPADILKNGLILVDTPGVNDINQQRASITYGFIPISDAIIFLLNPNKPVTKTERLFLEQHILKNDIRKIFFVLNKKDLLEQTELKDAIDSAHDRIKSIHGEHKIYALSAKDALSGKLNKDANQLEMSGILSFEKEIKDFVINGEKGIYKQISKVNKLEQLGQQIESTIELEEKWLNESLQEIDNENKQFQIKLEQSEEYFKKIMDYIDEQKTFLARVIHKDIKSFYNTIKDNVLYQIDTYKGDLKEYVEKQLPFYLKQSLKGWVDPRQKVLEVYLRTVNDKVSQAYQKLFIDRIYNLRTVKFQVNTGFTIPGVKFELNNVDEYKYINYAGTAAAGILAAVLSGGFAAISFGLIANRLLRNFYQKKAVEEQKIVLRSNIDSYLNKILSKFEDKIIQSLNKYINIIKETIKKDYDTNKSVLKTTISQIIENRRNKSYDIEKRNTELKQGLNQLVENKNKLLEIKTLLLKESTILNVNRKVT